LAIYGTYRAPESTDTARTVEPS
ncbi:MAG: hypothetical protein QOI75_1138, partial [Pseudonocardiales bacterium]|nr:hypothetical protein [Pseudonocardiales bacterium]